MKLFIYEHCPFCVRARMIFGFKNIPFEISVIMEGDVETPTKMVGRKVVPILQKEDGSFMPESMDIVHYVDALVEPKLLTQSVDPEIESWLKKISTPAFNLAIPRFTKSDFKELSTPEARQAYFERETKAFGDLEKLMDQSEDFVQQVLPLLEILETYLSDKTGISVNDFMIFPILRTLSIVKGLVFGPKISEYMLAMEKASRVDLLFDKAK